MSFRYDTLNLAVLDSAREVFSKPSTQWTDEEHTRAVMIIEAMRIVASQFKKGQSHESCGGKNGT